MEIRIATEVKQQIKNVDLRGLWPFHSPQPAAAEEQLRQVELQLGEPLDPLYRAFLSNANGWTGFFQRVDLFGSSDLCGGPRKLRALGLLKSIEDFGDLTGHSESDVSPIAVSQDDIDLFVLTKTQSEKNGEVLWLAGGLIDTFLNFDEYFLAMVDYNRREVQRFEGKLSTS